jgi:hypothetical protein
MMAGGGFAVGLQVETPIYPPLAPHKILSFSLPSAAGRAGRGDSDALRQCLRRNWLSPNSGDFLQSMID